MLLGWSLTDDDGASGVAMMTEALDHVVTRQAVPYFSYLLGSRLCEHGRGAEALDRFDAGLSTASETGERLWLPLLHFGRAQCLAAAGDRTGAVVDARRGLEHAQKMGADFVRRRCEQLLAELDPGTEGR